MVKIETRSYWPKLLEEYRKSMCGKPMWMSNTVLQSWVLETFNGTLVKGRNSNGIHRDREFIHGYIAFQNDADATFFTLRMS